MNTRNYLAIILLVCILAGVSASSITGFSINSGNTYTNATTVSLTQTITADPTCLMCFSEDNNAETCSARVACANMATFVLSSANAVKTIYPFLYDDAIVTPGTTDSITLDTTAPTYTISGVTDGNIYTTQNFSITITANETNAFDHNSFSFSGSQTVAVSGNATTITATLSATNLNDGNYTLSFDLNDLAGNRTTKTIIWTVDTNAPTNESISFSGWTNADKPTFTVGYTHTGSGVQIKMSCNNSTYTSWNTLGNATTFADFNINDATYGCSYADWNKTVYAKFRDLAGNEDTNVYRATVFYDAVAPSTPTGFNTTAGNTTVTLNWIAPIADNNSGNLRIEIYRNGSYAGDVAGDVVTYQSTSLTNGTSYAFKIRTKDAAGNYSAFTSETSATPQALTSDVTVRKNGASVSGSYTKNGDILNVSCSYTSTTTLAKIKYAYFNPNTNEGDLATSSAGVSSLSENITINTGSTTYEKIGFWCTASGAANSSSVYVYLDNTAPTANWNDTNNQFFGIRRVSATVTDNTLLDTVDINFVKVLYGTTKEGTNYYYDINTLKFENGQYALKLVAYDKAGNKTEINRTITIENILSDKQKALQAISEALAKQVTANDLTNYFKREGLILSPVLVTKKNDADTLVHDANALLATDTNTALAKATQANTLFTEFNTLARIETMDTKTYTYDGNNLPAQLQTLGFSEELAQKIAAYITNGSVERKIKVIKAGDDTKRQIQIVITLRNDTNDNIIKVIEIIPKELLNSASDILSDVNYRILQDDPIIEFTLPLAPGATSTITYGIGEVSTEQATKLMQDNVIAKFSHPPVVLDSNTVAEESMTKALAPDYTLLIMGIIVLLLIIIIALVVFRFSHPGHGFGEKKNIVGHLTPEQEAEKKKWEAHK